MAGIHRSIKTTLSKAAGRSKRYSVFLAKTVYIGAFFVISLLLLRMIYFPELGFSHTSKPRTGALPVSIGDKTGETGDRDKQPRHHFHITDEYVDRLESGPTICLVCHGVYPHGINERTASFLNMHIGFMTCEVCHIRMDPRRSNHFFTWVDLETGKTSMKVKGGYGKYPAKITSMINIDGKPERLVKLISENFALADEQLKKGRYAPENVPAVVNIKRVHEINLSKEPVTCNDCHKKNGYLDLKKLGFPRHRIDHLALAEVSFMVEQYKTFYMPRMLDLR
jgi:hypothetical protein